jgi:hypothetical protein
MTKPPPSSALSKMKQGFRLDLWPPRIVSGKEPVLSPNLHRVSGAAALACLRRRAAIFVPSQERRAPMPLPREEHPSIPFGSGGAATIVAQ